MYGGDTHIGPELQFGHMMGDRFEELKAMVEWQRGRLIGLQFKAEPGEVARVLGDVLPAIKSTA